MVEVNGYLLYFFVGLFGEGFPEVIRHHFFTVLKHRIHQMKSDIRNNINQPEREERNQKDDHPEQDVDNILHGKKETI